MYYDSTSSSWVTTGVTTVSYDNTTGIVSCATTHLSEFSLSSTSYKKNNDSGVSNNTIYNYYFDEYPGFYAGSVAAVSFIVLATIVISLKSYTLWDSNPFNL